jgi:CheY-like chemotaxis protein
VRVFKNHRMPINEPLLHQPVVIQPFDLVFMDLQMPICDGLDATRQIRALEQEHGWNKSVILIVTGQDSPADRSNANEVGANAYIVKPIGPKDLDIWVKQCFFDLSE